MISIIIPVYNTEKFLEKCILSCLNQTYSDIEVILINDASSDNSIEIIHKFEDRYPNKVRSLSLEKNMKQGYARNRGIEIARGQYLCFVDSDDYLDVNTCKDLYDVANKSKAEIVCTNGYNIQKDKVSKYDVHSRFDVPITVSLSHFTSQCYMLISRKLIIENELFYPEGSFHEDMGVVPIWYLMAQKVVFTQGNYWYINRHTSSTTKLFAININGILDRFKSAEKLIYYADRHNMYWGKNKKIIDAFILSNIILNSIKELVRYKNICYDNEYFVKKVFNKWGSYSFDWSYVSNEICSYEIQLLKLCLNNCDYIFQINSDDITLGRITSVWCEKDKKIRDLLLVLKKREKKPVIYGLGYESEKIAKNLEEFENEIVFCDGSNMKIGKKYYTGNTIYSPKYVLENYETPCFIITSDRKYSEMVEYIKKQQQEISQKQKCCFFDLLTYLRYDLSPLQIIEER